MEQNCVLEDTLKQFGQITLESLWLSVEISFNYGLEQMKLFCPQIKMQHFKI